MTVRFHPAVAHLADFALSLPEAWADSPWGDAVVKVGKKIFVFASGPDAEEPHQQLDGQHDQPGDDTDHDRPRRVVVVEGLPDGDHHRHEYPNVAHPEDR